MDDVAAVRGGAWYNNRWSARCANSNHYISAYRISYTGFRCVVQYTPSRPETLPLAMLRGGSWFNRPLDCRVSYRVRFLPDGGNVSLGFRPAVTAFVVSKLDPLTNNWRAGRAT